ncbi:OsmC family protein [Sciscionella sediminilitoris]|uniref:OsmC family protein n=1 Tax=Sciscionella sediminilitoris TaxID=1445613 RepID=UPI0004DF0312|nr:OsmC family protein [Sciscionella sp. SE31]
MAEDTKRSVHIERTAFGRYRASNVRGGELEFGSGEDTDFTPVELLLAALGGCGAIDVDFITARRAEPESFTVTVSGDKIHDEHGNHVTNLDVHFQVAFPDGEAGDAARERLPQAITQSHERLCTVSRTIELGTPVNAHGD